MKIRLFLHTFIVFFVRKKLHENNIISYIYETDDLYERERLIESHILANFKESTSHKISLFFKLYLRRCILYSFPNDYTSLRKQT